MNPIEKVERSTLIVATTVQGRPASQLLQDSKREAVAAHSPALFTDAEEQRLALGA